MEKNLLIPNSKKNPKWWNNLGATIFSPIKEFDCICCHSPLLLWFLHLRYEPRYDRHTLNYGAGSNVKAMGPPRKILYKEDTVRAQFYKVFCAEDVSPINQGQLKDRFPPIYNETFNLLENKVRWDDVNRRNEVLYLHKVFLWKLILSIRVSWRKNLDWSFL